jgi:uncharacterized membrane protein
MLRAVARLAVLGGLAAVVADRWLAGRATTSEPIVAEIDIDAPVQHVWDVATDIPGQPRWMRDLVSVRLVDDGPVRVGTRATGTVRILGIQVEDPITVSAFDPPDRYAISHDGPFAGAGEITFGSAAGGGTHIRWVETLIAPVLPHLAAVVQGPVFRIVFQADLERLKRLIETGSTEGDEPPLVRLIHV